MIHFYKQTKFAGSLWLLVAMLLLSPAIASAQQAGPDRTTVRGIVKDQNGAALAGVAITEDGVPSNGVSTATDGRFEMRINPGAALSVMYLGYESQSIPTGTTTYFDITLQQDIFQMDDVVVIGYGSIKRGDVTSAVTSLGREDFIKGMVKSPEQLLQGKVAGLQISNWSGDPTQDVQMSIRGVNSLSGSTNPLVVIDGIPGGSLAAISPEDIETIDVLKDGSAAAIYGTRGTNGVIIVTTKRGTAGAPTVEYNGSVAIESISKNPKMLTAADYRKYIDDPAFPGLVDEDHTTDWVDAISRTAISHSHYLSLRGGTEKSNYIAGIDYRKREGVINRSDRESITVKFGLNQNMLDNKLRFQFNFNDSYVTQQNIWYNAYTHALRQNPTRPIYDEDGHYTEYKINLKPYNPVAMLNEETDRTGWNQLMMNGKLIYTPIEGLNFSIMGAMQRWDRMENKYNTFEHMSTTVSGDNGNVWNWADNRFEKTMELVADYTKQIDKHYFTAMAGYSYQENDNKGIYQWGRDFETDIHGPWNIGSIRELSRENAAMSSYRNTHKLIAFFGRVSYTFDDKYLFMASIRRDGSSRFGKGHKWGWFPAVSAGWRISNEDFMDGVTAVDDLKLRVGYGVTGTEISSSYQSLALLGYGGYGYLNDEWLQGILPIQTPNPDLRWEKKAEVNIGLDFSFMKGKLTGNIDLYDRTTSDLLGWYSVAVPPNITTSMMANVGKIQNKGIEIMLNGVVVNTKDLRFDIGATYTFNKNKIKSLSDGLYQKDYWYEGNAGSPIQTHTHIVAEGGPVGNFHGFKTARLNEYGKWLVYNAAGEEILLSDAQDSDRQVIGNGIPSSFASLNFNFAYKGFDLTVAFRGAFNFSILNTMRMHWESISRIGESNLPRSVLEKPFGSGAFVNDTPEMQSYYVEKGDYVKLDNISIGYTFNVERVKYIQRIRLFATAYNVATITRYKGTDPEVSIKTLTPAVDATGTGGIYPKTSVYTFGLNLLF